MEMACHLTFPTVDRSRDSLWKAWQVLQWRCHRALESSSGTTSPAMRSGPRMGLVCIPVLETIDAASYGSGLFLGGGKLGNLSSWQSGSGPARHGRLRLTSSPCLNA